LRYSKKVLGLKTKAGLLFFISVGIFACIVVFGNTIASKKIRSVPEADPYERIGKSEDIPQNPIGVTVPLNTENEVSNSEKIPTITSEMSANITQSLASLIGKNIVDKNPEGPTGENLTVMGADGMADMATKELLKQFNPAYFLPEISTDEIIIDNTENSATYRTLAEAIIAKAESTLPQDKTSVTEKMKFFAKNYERAVTELRALAVPQEIATEHIKTIRITEGRRRIFEAVADYENDPIYAMLALTLWNTLK